MLSSIQSERRHVLINGIVQGVGFRPFVYNLAVDAGLTGYVTNTSNGVEIEVEGPHSRVSNFLRQLQIKAPPLSIITNIESELIRLNGDTTFIIQPSEESESVSTLISPDVAVCDDCLSELFDPNDRRYRYPFINCTNCGPRYTIIESIPYDRPFTSMREFVMCPTCQKEYDDPTNRRFHAQPNACPECGPKVSLHNPDRSLIRTDDYIAEAASLLKSGSILAIKGLGGYHLAVDATNKRAVRELRRRKGREEKPLAVMVKDINRARQICYISPEEEDIITSTQTPIVLIRKKDNYDLTESVAPDSDRFGVMLPYTPLHHLLMDYGFTALVMTSGNYSEEPICIDNDEAFSRLGSIADYFLIHDRDIYLRSDDSVVVYLEGSLRPIRRSRGFVPRPVFVNSRGPAVLAVGGELKNTVCLLKDDHAFLSQHIGDLENLEAYNFFQMTIKHLQKIFETKPELIVYDLHPNYLSTQWTLEQKRVPVLGAQHHHAHLASCMAENGISGPVIGIIMDGTGFGTEGTIWGGEILIGDYGSFERYAHFQTMPLPGGDAAIKAPWRTAVSYLYQVFEGEIPELPFMELHEIEPIIEMVSKDINCIQTSSCGRLFDAVAAMCGGLQTIHYEAQAAIGFMQVAGGQTDEPFEFRIKDVEGHKELMIDTIIRAVVDAIKDSQPLAGISQRFHGTLIKLFSKIAQYASDDSSIRDVVLSGGVFQNELLIKGLIPLLENEGLHVFTQSQVPTNDGGLALGQVMIGRNYLKQ
ncbi:MAG: carbamoyltransferase HypF [Fidelibacterota bacterium]